MLTKNDLTEIAKLLKPLEDKIDARFGKVEERLDKLGLRLDKIEARMEELEEELKDVKEDTASSIFQVRVEIKEVEQRIKRSVRESQNVVIDFFDKEFNKIKKRVDRIEDHLKLPSA